MSSQNQKPPEIVVDDPNEPLPSIPRLRSKSISRRRSSTEQDEQINKYGISNAALLELKEIFSLVDRDGGGTISPEELKALMLTLGLKTTQAELKVMVQEIDSNQDGEVDFDEFVGAMTRKVSTSITKEKLLWAFKVVETHARREMARPDESVILLKGSFPAKYLPMVLSKFGDKKMSIEEAEDALSQIAPSLGENDEFDYVKYINVMFTSASV